MARPKPNLTKEQLKARSAMWIQKWRVNNPEKQKLARKRAYMNRKLKALNLVGIAKCIRCGCDEIDFLEFNHKGGGGCKEYKQGARISIMEKILTQKRNTDDLEILCRVCNALDFLERKNQVASKGFSIKWKK